MNINYNGKCIGLRNLRSRKRRKDEYHISLKWVIKFEQLTHEIQFNENMTADGLLKFLKLQEGI